MTNYAVKILCGVCLKQKKNAYSITMKKERLTFAKVVLQEVINQSQLKEFTLMSRMRNL